MSQKLRSSVKKRSIKAPQKGWASKTMNEIDPSSGKGAKLLENWTVTSDCLTTRKGYQHFSTFDDEVDLLWSHLIAGQKKLIVIAGQKLYEIAADGNLKLIAEDLPSGKWTALNYQGKTLLINEGSFFYTYDETAFKKVEFNETDHQQFFSGAVVYKGRLFYWSASSLSFYYGELHHIGGKVSGFDLSMVGNYKGSIVALNKMIIPSNKGGYEALAVFLSSGEVVFYKGSDPARAEDWAYVCSIKAFKPLNQQSILNHGNDLIVLSEDGYYALSQYLENEPRYIAMQLQNEAAQNDLRSKIKSYASEKEWSVTHISRLNCLLFNLPNGRDVNDDQIFVQHVFDLSRGVWTKFTDIPSKYWISHDNDVFFASHQSIYRAFKNDDDQGKDIKAEILFYEDDFSYPLENKRVTLFRPILASHDFNKAEIRFLIDHEKASKKSVRLREDQIRGVSWGSSWDNAKWMKENKVKADWYSLNLSGKMIAFQLIVETQRPVQFFGLELLFEIGGII